MNPPLSLPISPISSADLLCSTAFLDYCVERPLAVVVSPWGLAAAFSDLLCLDAAVTFAEAAVTFDEAVVSFTVAAIPLTVAAIAVGFCRELAVGFSAVG